MSLATVDLSPLAILDAFESYAGSITDLDRGVVCRAETLHTRRDQLSDWCRDRGLTSGDRVIVCVGNGPAFVTALTAILSAGGSPLLLHAETPPEELNRFAQAFGARFILSESPAPTVLAAIFTEVASIELESFPPLHWAIVDENDPEFDTRYPAIAGVPLHPTSGTTGRPKVAVRPARSAIAEADNYRETLAAGKSDRILCVVPMSHAYGFGTCVMLPLVSGADVVTTRRFNPRLIERTLKDGAITIFPAVPAMLDLLLVGAAGGLTAASRHVLSAGAPLPERTARSFLEKTGTVVSPLYGTTETGGISVAVGGSRPSVGACVGPTMRPVSVVVRLVATPEFQEGVGRVCVRSPSMMAGYLSHEGIDRSSIIDGWFETGDLGILDDDQRIHLLAREKEVINVFGMKVIPGEVEAVIARFPQIADVKAYAGTHRTGSQIVKVAIAAPESFDVAALKDFCRQQLAPYKRPEVILRLDALPRTPTGKIIRDQLP
jgi:acyl-CoA synthetase (AMP-forming)/AMP-acid ligase II